MVSAPKTNFWINKKREDEKIMVENQKLAAAILTKRPAVNKKEQCKAYQDKKPILERIQRFKREENGPIAKVQSFALSYEREKDLKKSTMVCSTDRSKPKPASSYFRTETSFRNNSAKGMTAETTNENQTVKEPEEIEPSKEFNEN